MLRVDNLKVRGLSPLSFDVTSRGCLAVVGPSGSGKTLLLRAIADLDAADGQVFHDGVERDEVSGPEWRRNVRYVASESGWWAETPRPHFSSDPSAALDALALAPGVLDRPIAQLSTGERQRLALARAIADKPPVLLLDEPTAALDPATERKVERLILKLLDEGCSIVLVTHNREQAQRLAGAALAFEDGVARVEPL